MAKVDMSKHFTIKDLLKYSGPSIAMMIFTSIYTVVDGLFVSNFAGKTAFASLNLIFPFIMILGTIGYMMGTGGSAIVGKTRGEGDDQRANRYFSMMVYCAIAMGAIFGIAGIIVVEPVSVLLGADESMVPDCVLYGTMLLIALPANVLQYAFGAFFMTAGKPKYGFYFTVAAGLMNIVLDVLLVGVLNMGLFGAALATDISMAVGGFGPVVYFARPNDSFLRLGRTKFDLKVFLRTCVNGSSEMVGNIAMSVVAMVYNLQLMALLGQNGVAAYGVIMYVMMIFGAVFIGYSMGASPLMSFQYGANNRREIYSIFKNSLKVISVMAICMFVASELAAPLLSALFVNYDQGLYDLTVLAFRLYSISYLLMGFNVYGSSMFTALNNGIVSAIISFLRSFVFEIGAVLLLPMLIGANGIWLAITVAELASLALTLAFVLKLGNRYGLLHGDKTPAPEKA